MEKNIAIITCNDCDQAIIDELNSNSNGIIYKMANRRNIISSSDIIIIMYELVKNICYSTSYDLLKTSILMILSKIKPHSFRAKKIVIIFNNKKSEIIFPFELNDEQKDKVVNAAIEKILKE